MDSFILHSNTFCAYTSTYICLHFYLRPFSLALQLGPYFRRYSGLRRCHVGTLVSTSVNRGGQSSKFLLLKVVTTPLFVTTTPSFQEHVRQKEPILLVLHTPNPSPQPPGRTRQLHSARPEALPRVQPHRSSPGLYLRSGLEKLCAMRDALVLRNRAQKTAWISPWKGWRQRTERKTALREGTVARLGKGRSGAEGRAGQ